MDAFFGILENTNLGGPDDNEGAKVALEVEMYGGTTGHPTRPFGGFRNNGWFTGDPRTTSFNPDINTAYAAGRKFTYVNDSLAPNANDGTVWGKVASGTYDAMFTAAFAKTAADGRWTPSNPFHYSFHHEQSVTSEGGGNLAGTPLQYAAAFRRVAYLLWNGGYHASQGNAQSCILLCYICDGNQYVGSSIYGKGTQTYSVEACNPNQPTKTGLADYSSTVTQTTTLTGKLAKFYDSTKTSIVVTKYADVGGGDLYSGLHGVHTWGTLGGSAQQFAIDCAIPWMTGETGCATTASSKLNTGIYSTENYAADMLAMAQKPGATGIGPGQLYGINYTHRSNASGGDYSMDATSSIQSAWKATVTDPVFSRQAGVTVTPPGKPGSPSTGAVTTSSVVVDWTAASVGSNPISYYQIQFRVTGSGVGGWQPFGTTTASLTLTVTGLSASTGYDFQIAAVDNIGTNGPWSNTTTGTTTGTGVTPPSIPGSFHETSIAYNEVDLAWNASTPGTNPINHYQVSEATLGVVGTPTATSLKVTGLTELTTYAFTVSCWDNTGVTSGESSPVDVTTPKQPSGGDQTVNITNPANNQVMTQATIQVRATITPGTYPISSVTVTVNSSAPVAMNQVAGTENWTKTVTIVSGSNSLTVTATDSTGAPVSELISVSFGNNLAPTFTILNPTGVDEVLLTQQITVSIDWEDADGIDVNSVMVSTDGVTWYAMTYNPPAASSGTIGVPEGG